MENEKPEKVIIFIENGQVRDVHTTVPMIVEINYDITKVKSGFYTQKRDDTGDFYGIPDGPLDDVMQMDALFESLGEKKED